MVYPPGLRGMVRNPSGWRRRRLLGALVLGDGLGALGDGVLGELTGEDQTHGGLNLAGGHGLALVVHDQAACLAGDAPEGVANEGVQHGHGPLGDAGVRVDLLEDAVDHRTKSP